MRTDDEVVDELRTLIKSWGGELVKKPADWFSGSYRTTYSFKVPRSFSLCPFSLFLGVDHRNKMVYFDGRSELWPLLLHETAHVFASRKRPQDADEFDFLGWEWKLAQRLGGDLKKWHKYMKNYGADLTKYENLSIGGVLTFLRLRIRDGKKVGNLTPDGIPVSIRK